MNNLQMLKKAMLAYVSAVKFVWSSIAYPLSIVGKKLMNLRGYRVYGNSVQDGTPTPDSPVEIESVGDLSTKNLFDCSKTPNNIYSTKIDANFIRNDDIYTVNINFPTTSDTDNIALSFVNNGKLNNLKPNTTYTVCVETLGGQISGKFRVYIFSGDTYKSLIHIDNSQQGVKKVRKITTTDADYSTYKIYGFYLSKADGGCVANNVKLRISCYEGDYTSETIPDYEPYHKYKIPVVARGKNLIKLNKLSYSANGGTITNNQDGTYTLSGTPTGYCGLRIGSIPSSLLDVLRNNVCVLTGFYYYEKNVRITLNVKLNGSYIKYIYLNPYTYNNYVKVDLRTTEFDEITFSLSNQNNNVDFKNVTVKPLLEVGTTMPTSFEPYIAPVTKNIYLDEPLRKIGDYADYIDYEKQKVVRNVKEVTFNGTEDWRYNDTNNIIYLVIYKLPSSVYCYSTHFLSEALRDDTSPYFRPVADILRLYQRSNNIVYPSADEFKTFLQEQSAAGTPLIVHYILATPIEETVNLPALPQFKGTTIYEVGTNIKPSGMEVKYV